MKLNLGCSDDLKPGWVNVDIDERPDAANYVRADLNKPWPWPDSSIDAIYAHDVFEHIHGSWDAIHVNTGHWVHHRPSPKIWCMNEAWRVLKPGGVLDIAVPCVHLTDRTQLNPAAFSDPTHVSYWTWDDQFYFSEQFNTPDGERGRLGPAYGITALFKFPAMAEVDRGVWVQFASGKPDQAVWRVVEYGPVNARRAKLVGLLEAVK